MQKLMDRLLTRLRKGKLLKLPYTVTVNGAALPYVTRLTAKQTQELAAVESLGIGTVQIRQEKLCWDVTVEELLPVGQQPDPVGVGTFILQVRRQQGYEQYIGCRWISAQCKETPWGLQQIRVARTWEEREVNDGLSGV